MVKRVKKIEKGIESLRKEIEEHFIKLEEDIRENRIERGRYHIKEIDKSLITALKYKISLLGENSDYSELIKKYNNFLEEYKKKLGIL